MKTSLTCRICGDNFPSVYWFKSTGVCIDCFKSISEAGNNAFALPVAEADTTQARNFFPTLGEGFVIVISLLVLQIVSGLLLPPIIGHGSPAGVPASYTAMMGIVLALCLMKKRSTLEPGSRLVRFDPPRLDLLGIGAVLTVILIIGSSALLSTIYSLFHPTSLLSTEHMDLRRGPFWIVVAVVIAPVFEETLFRGIILDGFLKQMGRSKAVLWTAVLFAFCHFSYSRPSAFAAGLILGWIYTLTKSITIPMILHALNNGILEMGRAAMPDAALSVSTGIDSMLSPVWTGIIVLGAGASIAAILYHIIRREDARAAESIAPCTPP